MCGIVKSIVRIGLLTAVVGGAVVVIAGPPRVRAMINNARGCINARIDRTIDDPVALRAQIKDLESQYPKRIADVRRDFDEVSAQVAQLERELAVSQRVIDLAENDLAVLQGVLAKAEDHRGSGAIVRVRLGDDVLSTDQAYSRATSITQVRDAYAGRAQDITKDLGYLREQEDRLGSLLAQLESEQAEFQSQLWSLDRQIDAIGRNERLISIMEKREARIEEHGRYEGVSLDRLRSQLAGIRAGQESRLERLAGTAATRSYEDRARFDINQNPEAVEFAPQETIIDADECKTGVHEAKRIARRGD